MIFNRLVTHESSCSEMWVLTWIKMVSPLVSQPVCASAASLPSAGSSPNPKFAQERQIMTTVPIISQSVHKWYQTDM